MQFYCIHNQKSFTIQQNVHYIHGFKRKLVIAHCFQKAIAPFPQQLDKQHLKGMLE
jgi:phage-related protein